MIFFFKTFTQIQTFQKCFVVVFQPNPNPNLVGGFNPFEKY